MRKTFRQIKRISIVLIFFLGLGCNYSFDNQSITSFMIAPIHGDLDGAVTTEVVRAVSTNPSIDYQNSGAEKVLIVTIHQTSLNTIGYRKDRRRDLSIKENILSSEARKTIEAQIEVIDRKTQETLLGPVIVSAFVDFDYVDDDSLEDLSFLDASGARQTILRFSLGQLTPQQSASDAASRPLYKKLAQKIVDVISTEW